LFGQSAGGASVCYHYTSPASAGLFSSMLAQSALCSDPSFFQPLQSAFDLGTAFAKHIGCGSGGDFTLECIRALPTDDVLNYYLEWAKGLNATGPLPLLLPVMPWVPVIDGAHVGVLDRPYNLVQKGIFNKVPAAFGVNENDGSLFVPLSILIRPVPLPLTEASLTDILLHFFQNNTEVVSSILAEYPESDYIDNYQRMSMLLRDGYFECVARAMIRSVRSQVGSTGPATYLYRFNRTLSTAEGELLGDYHGSELPYVWNWPNPTWTNEDFVLSWQMGCFWSSMAKAGNPNESGCADIIEWPANTGSAGDFNVVLDAPLRIDAHLSSPQCDFWDTIGYNV
jgi:carboxylesterase type B